MIDLLAHLFLTY